MLYLFSRTTQMISLLRTYTRQCTVIVELSDVYVHQSGPEIIPNDFGICCFNVMLQLGQAACSWNIVFSGYNFRTFNYSFRRKKMYWKYYRNYIVLEINLNTIFLYNILQVIFNKLHRSYPLLKICLYEQLINSDKQWNKTSLLANTRLVPIMCLYVLNIDCKCTSDAQKHLFVRVNSAVKRYLFIYFFKFLKLY